MFLRVRCSSGVQLSPASRVRRPPSSRRSRRKQYRSRRATASINSHSHALTLSITSHTSILQRPASFPPEQEGRIRSDDSIHPSSPPGTRLEPNEEGGLRAVGGGGETCPILARRNPTAPPHSRTVRKADTVPAIPASTIWDCSEDLRVRAGVRLAAAKSSALGVGWGVGRQAGMHAGRQDRQGGRPESGSGFHLAPPPAWQLACGTGRGVGGGVDVLAGSVTAAAQPSPRFLSLRGTTPCLRL